MKFSQNFQKNGLRALGGFSLLSIISVFIKGYHDAPFIDEVDLNLTAVRNLLLHGNWTTRGWGDFTPFVSSGIWTIFPSGFAYTFGAPLSLARLISFCFSLSLIGLAARVGLNYFKNLSSFQKNWLTLIFVGFFISLIPYRHGAYMTLGEIPAGGYFGLALALLQSHPALAFFFMGVCTFGGKIVYVAYVIPLICLYLLFHNSPLTKKLKNTSLFFLPLVLWVLLMLCCIGPIRTYSWFTDLVPHMFHQNGQYAAGVIEDLPHLYSLPARLKNPLLEWAQYGFPQKIRVLLLFFFPIFVILRKVWLGFKSKGSLWLKENPVLLSLFCGQCIFIVWYFFFHPFMWIRSVQPAFIVGISFMGWEYLKSYLNNVTLRQPLLTAGYCTVLVLFFIRLIEALHA